MIRSASLPSITPIFTIPTIQSSRRLSPSAKSTEAATSSAVTESISPTTSSAATEAITRTTRSAAEAAFRATKPGGLALAEAVESVFALTTCLLFPIGPRCIASRALPTAGAAGLLRRSG